MYMYIRVLVLENIIKGTLSSNSSTCVSFNFFQSHGMQGNLTGMLQCEFYTTRKGQQTIICMVYLILKDQVIRGN